MLFLHYAHNHVYFQLALSASTECMALVDSNVYFRLSLYFWIRRFSHLTGELDSQSVVHHHVLQAWPMTHQPLTHWNLKLSDYLEQLEVVLCRERKLFTGGIQLQLTSLANFRDICDILLIDFAMLYIQIWLSFKSCRWYLNFIKSVKGDLMFVVVRFMWKSFLQT